MGVEELKGQSLFFFCKIDLHSSVPKMLQNIFTRCNNRVYLLTNIRILSSSHRGFLKSTKFNHEKNASFIKFRNFKFILDNNIARTYYGI